MGHATIEAGLTADENTFRFDTSDSMPSSRFAVLCVGKAGINQKIP
jgi:hypothetical protein